MWIVTPRFGTGRAGVEIRSIVVDDLKHWFPNHERIRPAADFWCDSDVGIIIMRKVAKIQQLSNILCK